MFGKRRADVFAERGDIRLPVLLCHGLSGGRIHEDHVVVHTIARKIEPGATVSAFHSKPQAHTRTRHIRLPHATRLRRLTIIFHPRNPFFRSPRSFHHGPAQGPIYTQREISVNCISKHLVNRRNFMRRTGMVGPAAVAAPLFVGAV